MENGEGCCPRHGLDTDQVKISTPRPWFSRPCSEDTRAKRHTAAVSPKVEIARCDLRSQLSRPII
jgi:hypothetical protein